MNLRYGCVPAFLVGMMLCGCSEAPRGGPPLTTTPVSGIVQVDGKPAEGVTITCSPDAGLKGLSNSVSAISDKDGKFEMTTYKPGDGLPEGSYTLTFTWTELMSVQPEDKLKGAYDNLAKSTEKFSVVKGEKKDLGVIELSTKGPKKK